MGWGKWLGVIGAAAGGVLTGGATWGALPAILSGGAKIAGGIMQHRSAGKAADQLQEGVQAGIGVQREALDPYMQAGAGGLDTLGAYGQAGAGSVGTLGEYGRAGAGQLSNLSRMANLGPSDIAAMAQMDPSYEFRRKEGMRGVERSAAAKGTLLTGGTLRDVIRYNQDYAGTEYARAYGRASEGVQQQYGRASTLAGMGQQAAGRVAGLGASAAGQQAGIGARAAGQFAGAVTDLTTAGANVAAQETVQKGNIVGDVLGGVANTIGGMVSAGRNRASAHNAPLTGQMVPA